MRRTASRRSSGSTRWHALGVGALVMATACSDKAPADPSGTGGSTGTGGGFGGSAGGTGGTGGGGGTGGLAPCTQGCSYPPLSLWQEPIADYILAASRTLDPETLRKAIDDFIVADDLLFFGYGDMNLNAGGLVPIAPRYWTSPDDTAPSSDPIVTKEEEILRYRKFGTTLYIPGVDASEDNFLGNVFVRNTAATFVRHRTVQGGVHVHDMAEWGGALYACGSGAISLEAWNTGKVHSYLWRSTDQGENWTLAVDIENEEQGDRRYVDMIPLDDELLIFGFRRNAVGDVVEILHDRWDGESVSSTSSATSLYTTGAERLDGKAAILTGIDVSRNPVNFTALRVTSGTDATVIDALAGQTVIDVMVWDTSKAVVVTTDGDVYPPPETLPTVRIWTTSDAITFEQVLSADGLPAYPKSVAYWKSGIYLGLENGHVFRSLARFP